MPPRMEGHIAQYHVKRKELLTGVVGERPKVPQRKLEHYTFDTEAEGQSESASQQNNTEELEYAA